MKQPKIKAYLLTRYIFDESTMMWKHDKTFEVKTDEELLRLVKLHAFSKIPALLRITAVKEVEE